MLSRTANWVKEFFLKKENEKRLIIGGHGFDHNQRVAGMAPTLSIMEKKDPFLPVLTSLLIDVGRTSDDPRALTYKHGELSREIVSDFVMRLPILTRIDKQIILNAVEDHPLNNEYVRRNYVVEIVMDADRLDSIGALGPVRAGATRWKLPLFSPDIKTSREEKDIESIYQDFAYRVSAWYKSLWTKSAKKIAQPRMKFLNDFIKEYKKEALFMTKAYRNLELS